MSLGDGNVDEQVEIFDFGDRHAGVDGAGMGDRRRDDRQGRRRRSAIPQATVTITFKSQAGKAVQTVKRTTLPSGPKAGTRTVKIPDEARTADITVTTANGKTVTRTDLDVSSLSDKESLIDVPGGNAPPPPQTARVFPRPGVPVEPIPVLMYPGGGGVPFAIGSSWTSVPVVTGGTRFVGGGETSIIESRRTIPGVTAALGVAVPVAFADYFGVIGSFNGFDDTVRGSVPVGSSSCLHLHHPESGQRLDRHRPRSRARTVTLGTKGPVLGPCDGSELPRARGIDLRASPARSVTYSVGLRYRYMEVDHTIIQQSPTFADLNQTINLNLRSHLHPTELLGLAKRCNRCRRAASAAHPPSCSPGALISNANARQRSRCGPCGGGSPEFDLVLQRGFSDSLRSR